MSRLRYAIVGCGRRGSVHLAVASKLTDYYEIVAVCDAHPPSAQAAGAKYGVSAYTDLRELVARESIDVCDVVVPIELHHAVSCYLSEQGIHQNVETPIVPTLALADMMIETAAKNGVKLQISENFPAIPVERMVQTIIQSGAIGQVGRCYRLFSTGGVAGRTDQEMILAMDRSTANYRQPVPLPLVIDLDEEARFNQSFETQFGCHPHDIERAIQVSFKAR